FPTVTGGRSRSEAICWFGWPAAAAKTIRLLSTSACAVDGACTQRFKVVLVFGSRLMAGAIRGMPQRTRISLYYKELSGRCTSFISVGSSDAETRAHYDNLRQNKPPTLASLLNLVTAMKTIQLPSKTPLDYFKEILCDESLAQDRFFGYADKFLVDQVRRAAMEGEFAPEPNPGLFHPDATSSFKQIQFGEANVQLTFHEKDTKTIAGVPCLKVEPDIDYFKDLGAHTLL